MRRLGLVAIAATFSVAACSLFVSLDGLDSSDASVKPDTGVGRDVVTHDGGNASDAHSDAGFDQRSPPQDAGRDTSQPDTGHDSGHDAGFAAVDAGAYANAVLSDHPLAYWHLDEQSGVIAHDATDGGHNGNINGGVTLSQPGVVGTAMKFNGSSGCIGINNGSDFEFADPGGGPFSIELWVNPKQAQFYWLASTEVPNNPGRYGWTLILSGSTDSDLEAWNGDANAPGNPEFLLGAYSPQGSVPLNTWTYLVGTWDGNTSARIYANGVEYAGSGLADLPAQGSLALGCHIFEAPEGSLDGLLDEVAVYGTALTQQQITKHYMASGR